MIKCTSCGRELEDGSLFCDNCGTPVSASAAGTVTENAPAADTQPAEAQPATQAAGQQPAGAQPDAQATAVQLDTQAATAAAEPAAAQQPAEVQAATQAAGQQPAGAQPDAQATAVQPDAQAATAAAEPAAAQQSASAFCPNCGSPVPAGSAFCPSCGADAVTGQVAGEAAEAAKAAEAAGQGGRKKPGGLLIGIAAACVAVLAVAAALVFAGGSKSSGTDHIFYIKDKEVFYTGAGTKSPMQITDNMVPGGNIGNSEMASVSWDFGYYFVKSDDGRLIFFPDKIDYDDDGLNLYYKKLAQAGKEGQKIDSDILAYSVNSAATLVTYIKDGDSLYSYNLKKGDKEKIAGDVSRYRVSDDGRKVYYLNDEDDLYIWRQGRDKEKIDSDVTKVCYNTDDFKTIYYMKEDSFYKKTEGKDKEKIASGVSDVLRVYDSGAAYYLKDNSDSQSIYDFVYDDKAEEDLNITEPEYPSYPSRYSYASDSAYNAAVAEYNKARDKYEEKYEEYEQKRRRDNIRDTLDNYDSFKLDRYVLCYYDGRNEEKITEEFYGRYNYTAAADSEVIVYRALDTESVEKVKLSKFENVMELESTLGKELTDTASRYVAVKEKASEIDTESGQNFTINAKGDRILFMDEVDLEKYRGSLYLVKVNNGKVSSPELYDSDVDVNSVSFMGEEHIRYFKDWDDGSGELYIDKKQVDYDVYAYSIWYDSDNDKFCYFTDYSSSKEQGTLKVYKSGKSEKVADDVTYGRIIDGDVYYLSDYSQKSYKGELYRYSGRKSRKVDDDVVCVVGAASSRIYQGGAYKYGW